MTTQPERSRLNSVIQKFKFEELESTVMLEFPEITWDQVRSCLIRHHESFTTFNVLKIIKRVIREKKLSEKDLRSRLSHLEVVVNEEVSEETEHRTKINKKKSLIELDDY